MASGVRKMSATSRAGRPIAALRRVQPLQRTDDLAQDVGGDLGIQGCRFQFLVAEQYLDQADVDLLLRAEY